MLSSHDPLKELGVDVFCMVLEHLDLADLVAVEKVNKAWYDLTKVPSRPWKNACLQAKVDMLEFMNGHRRQGVDDDWRQFRTSGEYSYDALARYHEPREALELLWCTVPLDDSPQRGLGLGSN